MAATWLIIPRKSMICRSWRREGLPGLGWPRHGEAVTINSSFGQPSAELITAVQEQIDPVAYAGQGAGIAPIDHVVTIAGVTTTAVNIATTITYQSGYAWADIRLYKFSDRRLFCRA